jgi:hypothetical protein
LSLLYRSFYDLPSPGKTGRRFPIDTSKYQKLAFRMSDSLGGGDNPQVYWFHYAWSDPAIPVSDPTHTGYGVRLLGGTIKGLQTYVVDLSQAASAGIPWTSGNVLGFRLDPNGTHVGQDIYFNWVRLTYPDNAAGAAMQTISWSGGGAKLDLYDAAGTTLVMNIATSVASPFKWNYGVVPPGTYTLRVAAGASVGTRTFAINNPPLIRLTDPDETGADDDYASAVLNNPWDMDGPVDVQLTGSDNYTPAPAIFANGIMTATNTTGDPSVTLLGIGNNATPIDTGKYRYLTYRLLVDGPFDLANGSVARVFWSSAQFLDGGTATTTKDIIVWPGWNSYTLDLSSLSPGGAGGLELTGPAELWTSGVKRHLRIDPHEFASARTFHFDFVKLAPIDHTTNNSFTIKWAGSDADGGIPSVNLYYDTDKNPSNGKTLIASGVAMNAGQFVWATGGVAPADYWIYAEASDGIQVYGTYSTGQVRVTSSAPITNPVMALDAPANGSNVGTAFTVAGWAIDTGAVSGTGVDAVHVWAYPSSGPGLFVGVASYGGARSDVGAIYGARFSNSGFALNVSGLALGTYTLVIYPHSSVTGQFAPATTRTITIAPQPLMSVDTPTKNAITGTNTFGVAGWALDRSATSGTGVDAVHVWAYPAGGAPPIFGGVATLGGARPDVGAAYGSQFSNAGFSLNVTLPSGNYQLVASIHLLSTGAFSLSQAVDITAGAVSSPLMAVDTPSNSAVVSKNGFTVAGWAIDRGSITGTGVNAVHVWAYPTNGGAGIFVATGLPVARPDVASLYGANFLNSGFSATGTLPAGTYTIVVYAQSTVTGTFNQSRSLLNLIVQ